MFESVPANLVAKLLDRGFDVARTAAAHAGRMAESRSKIRDAMHAAGVILEVPEDSLDAVDLADDDVAAVDGAVICDSQSIGDLCTAVAVSVGPADGEGDTQVFMESVPRAAKNKDFASGIMAAMEILMAHRNRAKVVLVDGSLNSGLITISKAVYSARTASGTLEDTLRGHVTAELREAVLDLLTDRRFVALPKYTTTNELARWLPAEFASQDAKTLATMALAPGEMTVWVEKTESGRVAQRSIGRALGFEGRGEDELESLMAGVGSCYYRPHAWTPAFRLDVPYATIEDAEATCAVLRAVRDNTQTSGILEPFPLYLVDQYAKHISHGAAPMVSMAAMENVGDEDAQLLLAMRYRS